MALAVHLAPSVEGLRCAKLITFDYHELAFAVEPVPTTWNWYRVIALYRMFILPAVYYKIIIGEVPICHRSTTRYRPPSLNIRIKLSRSSLTRFEDQIYEVIIPGPSCAPARLMVIVVCGPGRTPVDADRLAIIKPVPKLAHCTMQGVTFRTVIRAAPTPPVDKQLVILALAHRPVDGVIVAQP